MHPTLRSIVEAAAAFGAVASLFYHFLSTLALASFLKERDKKLRQAATSQTSTTEDRLPPVSILKPVKGLDPQMWESFCSHCEQAYPVWELIFGVSDSNDPAIEVVRRLQSRFPRMTIDLIVCDRILGPNIKVSNLVQMLPHARHDLIVVNDSDIRVTPDYLRSVVAPLARENNSDKNDDEDKNNVALVTCLYRAVASETMGSRLEALGISTDFVPGILSARFLEKGLHFGLGSTLALRRTDLGAIGGFEVLLDYLADDYELGRRIAATGKRIELSATTVATFLPAYTMRQFLRHQLRWSRTIRDARRWGYAGLIFTFGLPWALITLLFSRGALWAWVLLALIYVSRLAVGLATAVIVLNDGAAIRNISLLPLRDLIAPLIWASGFLGNRIDWRGDIFVLKNGRLAKPKT